VFGAKMLLEARMMKGGNEKIQEEMQEAKEEIEGDDAGHERMGTRRGVDSDGIALQDMEEGGDHAVQVQGARPVASRSTLAEGARNFCSLFLGPVFVQAFVLTFLGEWGDRSQIATIALGAAHNVYLVTAGTVIGHSCCTALAVIGGQYLSTKISVKHVTFGGAILFLLFGVIYLYESFPAEVVISIPISTESGAVGLESTNI